jgi:hypothetical protein
MILVSELASKFDIHTGKKFKIMQDPKYIGTKDIKVKIPLIIKPPSAIRKSLLLSGDHAKVMDLFLNII